VRYLTICYTFVPSPRAVIRFVTAPPSRRIVRFRCISRTLNGLTSLAKQGRERLFHQSETVMRQGERGVLLYVIVQRQAIRVAEPDTR